MNENVKNQLDQIGDLIDAKFKNYDEAKQYVETAPESRDVSTRGSN